MFDFFSEIFLATISQKQLKNGSQYYFEKKLASNDIPQSPAYLRV